MTKLFSPANRLFLAFVLAVLFLPACWNGSYNEQSSLAGSGRFQLTVEPSRTDVQGSHFLTDSATGDIWHLQREGGSFAWTRVADAPEDAADLQPEITGEDEPNAD
jgi:hypothetical protein